MFFLRRILTGCSSRQLSHIRVARAGLEDDRRDLTGFAALAVEKFTAAAPSGYDNSLNFKAKPTTYPHLPIEEFFIDWIFRLTRGSIAAKSFATNSSLSPRLRRLSMTCTARRMASCRGLRSTRKPPARCSAGPRCVNRRRASRFGPRSLAAAAAWSLSRWRQALLQFAASSAGGGFILSVINVPRATCGRGPPLFRSSSSDFRDALSFHH